MEFVIDERLIQGSELIADWPLCQVRFKNEQHYPWAILVPKRASISEIHQLSDDDQQQLTQEINALSKIIEQQFTPDKLNVAAIGNMVPQCHIHVVGRFKNDPLWPASIWQPAYRSARYTDENFTAICSRLQQACQNYFV